MKKTLKSAIAVTFFVFALTVAIQAKPNVHFDIQNNSSFAVGPVTVYNSNGVPTTINVPGPGTFSGNIPGNAVAAVINGQSVPNTGELTNITLPSGIVVQAVWTGNIIVITDQQQVNDLTNSSKHKDKDKGKDKN